MESMGKSLKQSYPVGRIADETSRDIPKGISAGGIPEWIVLILFQIDTEMKQQASSKKMNQPLQSLDRVCHLA